MKIVRNFVNVTEDTKKCVVALGNFDGVHLGHQSLLRQTSLIANNQGLKSAVITFEPHPLEILRPEIPSFRITKESQKISLFDKYGIEICFSLPFTKDFSMLSGEKFINDILVNSLDVSHIVIGYDFIFGHNRSGNSTLLKNLSESLGYGFSQINAFGDIEPFSSSRVRKKISDGDIKEAANILGHSFAIEGTVINGKQQGRKLGFPTANIALDNYIKPKFGVYAVKVKIGNEIKNGVANIGVRPTFSEKEPLLEVHLFDFSGDLYGKTLSVEFIDFIRPEIKFRDVNQLVEQIKQDYKIAKGLLHEK